MTPPDKKNQSHVADCSLWNVSADAWFGQTLLGKVDLTQVTKQGIVASAEALERLRSFEASFDERALRDIID